MRRTHVTASRRIQSHTAAGVAFLAALLTWAIFPRGIMPLNDGFGYLRSILLTFQHGRPWTDDWLEPWAAGFSTLGAIVLWTTHSMYVATYIVSALLAGIAAWFIAEILADRGVSPLLAGLGGLVMMPFPTILWKIVEVNCFSLYLVCLLAAIRLSAKGQWGAFLFFWALALCTRQTAVAWGVIPATAGIAALAHRSGKPWALAKPWLLVLAGGAWFFLVKAMMNKTHAQAVITDHIWDDWSWAAVPRSGGAGLGVCLAGLGLGNVAIGRLAVLRENRRRLLVAGSMGGRRHCSATEMCGS